MLLTTSVAGSTHNTDPKLPNPFDLIVDGKYIWVTLRNSSLVSKYSKKGCLISSVSVPTPTGIAQTHYRNNGRNKHDNDHNYRNNYDDYSRKCSTIYVASDNGTIYTLSGNAITTHINTSGDIAGIAAWKNKLYVAKNNFGAVWEYSGTTQTQTIADADLFAVGYRPFGVHAIDGKIYITYTNRTNRTGSTVNNNTTIVGTIFNGVGNGYINVYDPKCKTLRRLVNRQVLSIPYGIVPRYNFDRNEDNKGSKGECEEDRDKCKDDNRDRDDEFDLLVGNAGTGQIAVFTSKGAFKHLLHNEHGGVITNDGIMGMVRWKHRIYFVADNDAGRIGSLGVIKL